MDNIPLTDSGAASGPIELKQWAKRGARTLVDQALFSGWGLAVTLFASHSNSPRGFGAFAIAFAALMFTSGFDNAFVLEPMAILGPSRHSDHLRAYAAVQYRFLGFISAGRTLALLAVAGLLCLLGDQLLGTAFLGAAVFGSLLMIGWLSRQTTFVLDRSGAAVLGDVTALAAVLGLWAILSAVKADGPVWPFLMLGAAGLALSLVALPSIRFRLNEPGGGALSETVRTQLKFGSWQAALNVLTTASTQISVFVTASLLGLTEAGIFRASLLLGSAVNYVATGLWLAVLPSASEDFGSGRLRDLRRKAAVTNLVLVLCAATYVGVVLVAGGPLLRVIFGPSYEPGSDVAPLIALATAVTCAGVGPTLVLRAIQWPAHALIIGAPTALVAVVSTLLLTLRSGLVGTAYAMVLTSVVSTTLTWCVYAARTKKIEWGRVPQR